MGKKKTSVPAATVKFGLQTGDLHGITCDTSHWLYPPTQQLKCRRSSEGTSYSRNIAEVMAEWYESFWRRHKIVIVNVSCLNNTNDAVQSLIALSAPTASRTTHMMLTTEKTIHHFMSCLKMSWCCETVDMQTANNCLFNTKSGLQLTGIIPTFDQNLSTWERN